MGGIGPFLAFEVDLGIAVMTGGRGIGAVSENGWLGVVFGGGVARDVGGQQPVAVLVKTVGLRPGASRVQG